MPLSTLQNSPGSQRVVSTEDEESSEEESEEEDAEDESDDDEDACAGRVGCGGLVWASAGRVPRVQGNTRKVPGRYLGVPYWDAINTRKVHF